MSGEGIGDTEHLICSGRLTFGIAKYLQLELLHLSFSSLWPSFGLPSSPRHPTPHTIDRMLRWVAVAVKLFSDMMFEFDKSEIATGSGNEFEGRAQDNKIGRSCRAVDLLNYLIAR